MRKTVIVGVMVDLASHRQYRRLTSFRLATTLKDGRKSSGWTRRPPG